MFTEERYKEMVSILKKRMKKLGARKRIWSTSDHLNFSKAFQARVFCFLCVLKRWSFPKDLRLMLVKELAKTEYGDATFLPISGYFGTNLFKRGEIPWYKGPCLAELLPKNVSCNDERALAGNQKLRAVTIRVMKRQKLIEMKVMSGKIKVGMKIKLATSGEEFKVLSIQSNFVDVPFAFAGQVCTVKVDGELKMQYSFEMKKYAIREGGELVVEACEDFKCASQFQIIAQFSQTIELHRPQELLLHLNTNLVDVKIVTVDHIMCPKTKESISNLRKIERYFIIN